MMAKPSTGVEVKVENSKVIVAGREYVREHILVVGADSLRAHVDAEKGVTLEASYNELPTVESVEKDTVVVKRESARLVFDSVGSTVKTVKEHEGENLVTVEAEVFTVKFEVDDSGISVFIPKLGKLRVKELRVDSRASSSANVITVPFTVGIMSASGGVRARILLRDDVLTVEVSEADASN